MHKFYFNLNNYLRKYEQVITKSFAIKKVEVNEKYKIESSNTDHGAQCVFDSDSDSASSSSLLPFDSSSSKDEMIQRKLPLKRQPKSTQSHLPKSKTTYISSDKLNSTIHRHY